MLYSAVWLVTLNFGTKLKVFAKNRIAGLSLAYFLWVVIGALYSNNPAEAEKDIVLKIPFAAWAILLSSITIFTEKNRQQLLRGFALAAAAAILISFLTAVYNFILTGDESELFFSKLVSFKMIPPHYMGMYINFAYSLVLYRWLSGRPLFRQKWLNALLLVAYFITLIFLSVRMQFIVLIVINVAIFGFFYKGVSTARKFVITAGILVLMFGMIMALPGPKSRVKDTVNEIISFEEMVNDKQTNARKFLWREGIKVCMENFWFGTGTADADAALNKKLQPIDAKFWDGTTHYYLRDKNYNFHNAYLQHWATHGIIGFVIYLAMFLVPWFRKSTGVEGRLFLLVCALSFLTESMLQRQAGVLFFSFFYAVLFVIRPAVAEPGH